MNLRFSIKTYCIDIISTHAIIRSYRKRSGDNERGQKMTRAQLIAVYLDYRNNFLSIAGFAEYYGLYEDEAAHLINAARSCFNREHPEA